MRPIVLERRNDLFNAPRGWFHASTIEWGVETLGSDLRFLKYLGQHYYFRGLPRGVVLASAVRVSLGRGCRRRLRDAQLQPRHRRPRMVRMIDSTCVRSGASGASFRNDSKNVAIRSMRSAW